MRLSIRTDDIGYSPDAIHCRVFLDHADITRHCQTADEELGEVRVLKRSEEGEHYHDPGSDEAAWEILRGDVKIVLDNGGYDA